MVRINSNYGCFNIKGDESSQVSSKEVQKTSLAGPGSSTDKNNGGDRTKEAEVKQVSPQETGIKQVPPGSSEDGRPTVKGSQVQQKKTKATKVSGEHIQQRKTKTSSGQVEKKMKANESAKDSTEGTINSRYIM